MPRTYKPTPAQLERLHRIADEADIHEYRVRLSGLVVVAFAMDNRPGEPIFIEYYDRAGRMLDCAISDQIVA